MTKAESALLLVLLIVASSLQADVAAARRMGADDKQLPAAVAEAQLSPPPEVSGVKASPVPSGCTYNRNNPRKGPCPPNPSKP